LKEPAYVEIIHATPSLLCFDAFIGIDEVLCRGLKQTNQAQLSFVRMFRIACKETLKIVQGQLCEMPKIIKRYTLERTVFRMAQSFLRLYPPAVSMHSLFPVTLAARQPWRRGLPAWPSLQSCCAG